jgi:hypothetical protein
MEELKLLSSDNCTFTQGDTGLLRAEIKDGLCARQVVLKRLFPIRLPHQFISVSDGKKEVGIIEDLKSFDHDTRKLIEHELDHYYAVPVIKEIIRVKHEYGFYHWEVITDRGPCEFYVKGRTETVSQTSEGGLSVTDINNCRYLIKNTAELPPASRVKLEQVL